MGEKLDFSDPWDLKLNETLIITHSGKIELIASRESLPKKVVTNVLAQALGFSGVNFCLGFGR